MGPQWMPVVFLAVSVAVQGFEFDDEQYYEMPRLFELDDWNECLSSRRGAGAFCLGTFDLLDHTNGRLMNIIQNFSSDKFHFNHSHIHRGVCVTSRCPGVQGASLRTRFERCVENVTRTQYGLRTNLTTLLYCRPAKSGGKQVDGLDIAFAYVAGTILLMNLIGTAFDVWRSKDNKPNKYLVTWSLKVNWARLTANYSEGDPRLAALKPVQGMKVLTLLLIMMAHSVLAYHITYLYNPQFFEKSSHHFMSAYFQNGTSIVQTFIMVSSFLMAYNLLLYADADPKRKLSLMLFPRALVHRITRISPVYLFVIGFSVSWWAGMGEGPLWGPLVGSECSRCRDKWWAQALFVNNFVKPDVRCLIHTWFLAVDMQLYVVSALLTLALGRNVRTAMKVVAGLFFAGIVINFLAAYYFQLRPMVTLMFPEHMRLQFEGERSFNWLYQAPWDSFPASMVGLFVAFLHYHLQGEGCKPGNTLMMRVLYRMAVPAMFLWVVGGYLMKEVSAPVPVALYAAIDRPVFTSLTALAMFGFFNKIDSLWWRFLSWRGWEVLGRLALPAYLVHWPVALTQLAYRHYLSPVSVHEIGGHFLWTAFISYCLALPLHLLVELPLMKFLQAVLS